jgi:Na+/H+ antiporter NhaC
MLWNLIACLFYAIPALAIVLFVISLVRYLRARRANKKAPGTFSKKEIQKRELTLLVFLFIVGVLGCIFIGCIALLALALMGM